MPDARSLPLRPSAILGETTVAEGSDMPATARVHACGGSAYRFLAPMTGVLVYALAASQGITHHHTADLTRPRRLPTHAHHASAVAPPMARSITGIRYGATTS